MAVSQTMHVKRGVETAGLHRNMTGVQEVVREAYAFYGYECELTSATDGEHGPGSKHYTGEGLDFALNYVEPEDESNIRDRIKTKLGRNFDVVIHGKGQNIHIHVEHDDRIGR